MTGTVGKFDLDAKARGAQRHAFAAQNVKLLTRGTSDAMRLQEASEIAAVDFAGDETEVATAAEAAIEIVRGQPIPKMPRLVRERTHIAGADIEEMLWITGAVGEPQAGRIGFLDDGDLHRPCRIAQQMAGQQHAGGAAADNDNANIAVAKHAPSPWHLCPSEGYCILNLSIKRNMRHLAGSGPSPPGSPRRARRRAGRASRQGCDGRG